MWIIQHTTISSPVRPGVRLVNTQTGGGVGPTSNRFVCKWREQWHLKSPSGTFIFKRLTLEIIYDKSMTQIQKTIQLVRLTCCLLFFCYLGDFNVNKYIYIYIHYIYIYLLLKPEKIINCTILPILVCKASFKIQRLLIVHLNPYTLNHQGQPEECFFLVDGRKIELLAEQ